MNSISFPSVVEEHTNELQSVFSNLTDGLKIYEDNVGYIVGNLALKEGIAPHKLINSSPDEVEYRVLAKTAMLLLAQKAQQPINLTVGFPYATFKANREKAVEFFKGRREISYDIFTLSGNHRKKASIEVESIEVIPEIVGSSLAARSDHKDNNDSFVAGMGYGTFEACLTNQQGIVDRTVISTRGLRYAIELAMKELNKHYTLNLRTEHQFDACFQKGRIVINRQKIDISEVRTNALKQYYTEVISPSIKNTWNDDDYENSETLYLAGGGAMYPELVECFENEFKGLLKVQVLEDPLTAVSRGYALRSLKVGESKNKAVGIDLGNSQSVVTFYSVEDENN
jgi:plasmid segregation protein ParM